MGRFSRWLLVIFGIILVAGAALASWRQYSRAMVMKVAVGPAGLGDAELMSVFARALAANKWASVRLIVDVTSGPDESIKKLVKGEAQFAVVRADGAPSDRIRSIAVLHTDPVAIVSAEQSKLSDLGDLKDKALGVVGPPAANDALVAMLRKHYSLSGPVRPLPPDPPLIASAIKDKKVQALLFVAPTGRAADIGKAWAAIRNASHRKLTFVPIESASAIAAANSAYEAGEIPAGQFGGSPALPAEDTTTLQVATYLVADRKVHDGVVTALTRSLFEERQRMIADAPTAVLIKAASTDKDATIPIHPGAKAYYDGEETSLVDRYGDMVYYIPVLFGALGSLLVGLRRFLFEPDGDDLPLAARIDDLLMTIRTCETLSDLDRTRADLDAFVIKAAGAGGAPDQENTTRAALAIGYLSGAIADRRAALTSKS